MPQIECSSGPANVPIGSENYVFTRDEHGRYVCRVDNLKHCAILVGLDLYNYASDLTAPRVDTNDQQAMDDLVKRCEQLVIDLGKAEADLGTVRAELATERQRADRLQGEVDELLAAPPPDAPQNPAPALLGSDKQPATIKIGDEEWTLGAVVQRAFGDSRLSAADWNALTQPERETRIEVTIQLLNEEAQAQAKPDDLTIISGIGEAASKALVADGITTFAQIAALTPEALAALDKKLGLKGISERSGWLDQAKKLVADADAAQA